MFSLFEECQANARALDSLPEIVAALKALMPLWERDDIADEWNEEFKAASAALAKGGF